MIEFYRDVSGGYRFRVKSGNGEIVVGSEAYATAGNAKRGLETLRRLLAMPEVEYNNDMIPAFAGRQIEVHSDVMLVPQTVWTYKGSYRILGISETDLIQYDDEWRPSVKYTTEPDNGLRFYRADTEFVEKFRRVGV